MQSISEGSAILPPHHFWRINTHCKWIKSHLSNPPFESEMTTAVQSTSWISISTDAMQPTNFPSASSGLDLGVYKACKSSVLFLWKMLHRWHVFFINPACSAKMITMYIFTLLIMPILWAYVPPMRILWSCKHKDSNLLDSCWVYIVLWQ